MLRAADPERARVVESKWKAVCGDAVTLTQVLAARRETRTPTTDRREVLGRFMAGAAFVFLQELPSADELALIAAKQGWRPLRDDLARLDQTDDVDLGVNLSNDEH